VALPAIAAAESLRLSAVTVANATFHATAGEPSLFAVVGDIVRVHGWVLTGPGKFYAKGVVLPGGWQEGALAFVEHRFKLPGHGTIFGSGAEIDRDDEPFAVLGGTGCFTEVHGTYTFTGLPVPFGDGTLEFAFEICDAGPRPPACSARAAKVCA
jgi:hypothetical protein